MRIRGGCEAVIEMNPVNIADNLKARRIHTQSRVISRMLISLILLIGRMTILMSFPNIREIGMSLLASAGLAGLVAGIAARPVLGNLIAGLQIALSQPIRLDDVVIVQNEWGWIEEISGTYVVVRLWDERRLVVPCNGLLKIRSRTGHARARKSLAVCFCGLITACRWHHCGKSWRDYARVPANGMAVCRFSR